MNYSPPGMSSSEHAAPGGRTAPIAVLFALIGLFLLVEFNAGRGALPGNAKPSRLMDDEFDG